MKKSAIEPKSLEEFVSAVRSATFQDLEFLGKQLANYFYEGERDYEATPQAEITRMAHALIYTADNITETGGRDE